MDAHHQQELEVLDVGLHLLEIGFRLDRQPRTHPCGMDRLRQFTGIVVAFDMDRVVVGTGSSE